MTTSAHGDLEAVKTLVNTLEGFDTKDQERIIRWAQEKLGLAPSASTSDISVSHSEDIHPKYSETNATGNRGIDIKSFVESKNPPSDVQFAATVAYYYKFEAPQNERKDSVTSSDLQEACRKVVRDRLKDPGQTLRNAHQLGLLDKGAEKGYYSINTVGENLVAMTLPQQSNSKAVAHPKKVKAATK
jgi:hypothetical protein